METAIASALKDWGAPGVLVLTLLFGGRWLVQRLDVEMKLRDEHFKSDISHREEIFRQNEAKLMKLLDRYHSGAQEQAKLLREGVIALERMEERAEVRDRRLLEALQEIRAGKS